MKSILEQTMEELQGKENLESKERLKKETINTPPHPNVILNQMERKREYRERFFSKNYRSWEDDNLRGIGRY